MRNSHLTTYMLPVVPFHENLQARRWRSENLDVNVVVMPCGLATLEANLAAGDAQALRQVRLDENAETCGWFINQVNIQAVRCSSRRHFGACGWNHSKFQRSGVHRPAQGRGSP